MEQLTPDESGLPEESEWFDVQMLEFYVE